jgi:hypothetical protein
LGASSTGGMPSVDAVLDAAASATARNRSSVGQADAIVLPLREVFGGDVTFREVMTKLGVEGTAAYAAPRVKERGRAIAWGRRRGRWFGGEGIDRSAVGKDNARSSISISKIETYSRQLIGMPGDEMVSILRSSG